MRDKEGGEAAENCRGPTSQVLVGGGWESGFYCRYEKPGGFLPGCDFSKSPWLPSRDKERRVEGSKPLGSPRNAKGTPPRKPLSGLRNVEAKGLSGERGKEPAGPSQGSLKGFWSWG